MAQITIHDPYRKQTLRVSEKAFKLIYEPLGYTRLTPDGSHVEVDEVEAPREEKVEARSGDKDTAPAEQPDIPAEGAQTTPDERGERHGARRRGRRKAEDQAGA